MTSGEDMVVRDEGWRSRTLLVGSLLGAVTGLGVAMLLVKRAERQGGEMRLSTGEGMRLGLLVLGMLRQVADLATPDEEE
jgi:hypothetical protein